MKQSEVNIQNQNEYKSGCQARKQVLIEFALNSHWLRNWSEFFLF